MFFYLSKILWFFVDPGNILFMGLVIGALLSWTRWRRVAHWCLSLTALYAVLLATIPLGETLITKLENRFPPNKSLPKVVEGIIVLGGVVDQFISKDRGSPAINGAVERLTAFADLAKKYPQARLVFSGGSGVLFGQSLKEAHFVGPIFHKLGIAVDRIHYEDQSRNTAENAVLTKRVVKPSDGGQWIVITSAFHMPRAIGTFRQAGWQAIPYPVDYRRTFGGRRGVRFNFRGGMSGLAVGLHEWLGLTFYWFTGRTNEFFPGPSADTG
jgi:uncharacterized SAM-binding protein YcdF (DUF218 family)